MPKKAGVDSAETRQRLMEAAAAEFSQYGFESSSLRRISAEAGVTTGGLYFFFPSKDALFRAVIETVTVPFMDFIRVQYARPHDFTQENFMDTAQAGYESCVLMQDFYEQHKLVADIMLAHTGHPAVQAFLDDFAACSKAHYSALIEAWDAVYPRKHPVDAFALDQFVHMQVDTMLTLVTQGFSREEVLTHSRILDKMLRGAFTVLLAD